MLLHYLVKCTKHYYCTVNNVPCRTKCPTVHRHFQHTTDRHAIYDARGTACHQAEVGAVRRGGIMVSVDITREFQC